MPAEASLWFCVPAHGRIDLTAICLRQLRRTCDALIENGIEATAVVIGDRDNLLELHERLADLIGLPHLEIDGEFAAIERDNRFLSRRFNDAIQLACDPRFNPRPADYVVPCGSDDWVDHRIFLELPDSNTVLGFQRMSFVREDGRELSPSNVAYTGGCGIRVYPRRLIARAGYRPADEDRVRGCDTSILTNVSRINKHLRVVHGEIDARQIVDWKSREQQINSYQGVSRWRKPKGEDPFEALAGVFPDEALEEMQAHYSRELVPA